MSTTVTYKGATLTTVENETKTLTTGGTWMEGDLTLTDVSGSGSGWTTDGVADLTEPNGNITLNGIIGEYAFYKRTGITSITGATQVRNYGCSGCTSMTSFDASSITGNFGQRAFENCTALTRLESNTTANVGSYMFNGSGVVEVNFPFSGSVGNISAPSSAFRNATHLQRAFLSRSAMTANASYQNTPADLFNGCTALEVADIGWLAANQWKSMFNGCENLRTIIARGTSNVPTLSAWSLAAFGGVYSNPTESTIYVPQALISSYQTATNWSSAYSAGVTFAPIEGSEYEL